MKTLLYGGTFDPPHNGHMNNLRAALALVQPDRALVMPAGTPPHKHASATPAELRLQMCACFTALSPAVQVSDWEIRRGGRSYTVHTLEWLRGQDPDGALYLCVGSDMLLTFQEWYRWQDMLKMAALVVESRTGTDEAALHAAAAELKKAGGRVLFARAESYPCASSDIRSGKIPRVLGPAVRPPEVVAVITQHRLYGSVLGGRPPGRRGGVRAPRPTHDPKRLLCRGRACPARSIKIHHPFKGNHGKVEGRTCPAPTASQEKEKRHGLLRSQEVG